MSRHYACAAPLMKLASSLLLLGTALPAQADFFGNVLNAFTIDFVTVGNPGNPSDGPAGGGLYSAPYGGVGYAFRMSVTEVAQEWIDKAMNAGMTGVVAGAWTGSAPAANVTWYEAAAFVNWLNTSNGFQPAYDLSFSGTWSMNLWSSADAWQLDGENLYRHRDAVYFLPSENEWYKSAYHTNDGVDGLYWDYATQGDDVPTPVVFGLGAGAVVYQGGVTLPAFVTLAGGLSPYGTRGQNGNVWEWMETAADGSNDVASETRVRRGGSFSDAELALRPTGRSVMGPANSGNAIGFRVASVPEPSATLLLAVSAAGWLLRRRR